MTLDDDVSLGEAREYLLENVTKGLRCPCCTQFAKVYRWSLYGTAASALLLLYKAGGESQFTHSTTLKEMGHKGQGDMSRLRLWGLVEQETERRADGGRSGYWRLTPLGVKFCLGKATIRKYALVFDSGCLGFEGDDVNIDTALGKNFDYREMMA